MKKLFMFFLLIMSLIIVSCQATHLVYVHESNLGVALTPVTTQGTTKFSLGFDRETYALVPKKGDSGEAMSMAGVSRIQVKGITDIKFGHVVATGEAAAGISENAEKLNHAQKKLFKDQTQNQ